MTKKKMDRMESAWLELVALLDEVRAGYRKIGEKLLQLEQDPEVGPGGMQALKHRLATTRGIAQATLTVWYRIAKGDLPAEIIETELQHSTMANMPYEVAERIVNGAKFDIASPTAGRVTKMARDFTSEEHAMYTRPTGVLTIDKVTGDRPYRRLRATDACWSEDGKTLEVTVASERIHVLVAAKYLERAEA